MENVELHRAAPIPWSMTLERGLCRAVGVPSSARSQHQYDCHPGTVQANPGVNADALRPFQGYGPIALPKLLPGQLSWSSNATQSPLHSGLAFGVALHLLKEPQQFGQQERDLMDAYDPRGYKGPSTSDRTHVLVLNYIYDIPFLKTTGASWGRLSAAGNSPASASSRAG